MTGWCGLELRIDVPDATSPSWRRKIKIDAEVNWSIGDVQARLCEEPGINWPFVLKLTDAHLVGGGFMEQEDADVDIVGNVMWLQVIPEDCAEPDCEKTVSHLLRLFTAEQTALVESAEESEEEEEEEDSSMETRTRAEEDSSMEEEEEGEEGEEDSSMEPEGLEFLGDRGG